MHFGRYFWNGSELQEPCNVYLPANLLSTPCIHIDLLCESLWCSSAQGTRKQTHTHIIAQTPQGTLSSRRCSSFVPSGALSSCTSAKIMRDVQITSSNCTKIGICFGIAQRMHYFLKLLCYTHLPMNEHHHQLV